MPARAAKTEPPVVTLRSEPLTRLEIANEVVVAFVSVEFVENRFPAVKAVDEA